MNREVTILGQVYTIEARDNGADLKDDMAGYCNAHKHLIVIRKDWPSKPVVDLIKEILRHEIVHAFLHESELWDSSNDAAAWAVNEEMVDWFAIQGPKIYKAWKEAGAL